MRRRRPRRGAFVGLAAWQVLVGLVAVSVAVVELRLRRVDVTFPDDQPGDTWVIVGADSRAGSLPPEVRATAGSAQKYPGSRADIVLVLHRTSHGSTIVSVPRDLLVQDGQEWFGRLTHTLLAGEQTLVDSICHSLGIAADHLVLVDMTGFLQLIDTLGSIEITVDHPIRDPASALHIATAGRHHVDSTTALALVRSRQAEEYVDGRWTGIDDGAASRAEWAATVSSQMLDRARQSLRSPWTIAQVGWTGSHSLRLDGDTRIVDLIRVASNDATTTILATKSVGGTLVRTISSGAARQIEVLGFTRGCVPATSSSASSPPNTSRSDTDS